MNTRPRVSIGIPVYNGANFISAAIESALSQTFKDFELIICDNASTDETEEICRSYADRDQRVKYFRNEKNIGASNNYNKAFSLSNSSDFFKWQAHDDIMDPDYLERCISQLDACPDYVLCHCLIRDIDETGRQISIYDDQLVSCRTSANAPERFREAVLRPHRNCQLFAVVRRQAMEGSVLHGEYYCADKAFVVEMSLRGRFGHVDEPLFGYRNHPGQFTQMLRPLDAVSWHNPSGKWWNKIAYLMLYLNYVRMVHRNVDSLGERLSCYAALARWWLVGGNFQTVAVGLLAVVSPGAIRLLKRLRTKHESRTKLPGAQTPTSAG